MDTAKKNTTKILVCVIVVLVLAIGALAAAVLLKPEEDTGSGIGYAADVGVILTEEELQAAMDEAQRNANNGGVALRYKNGAYSEDGENFECYIVNSAGNLYDMFLTIYADLEMTDQLFLSGLVPPGSGFEKLKLDHPLEKGDHTVYVAVTQVDRDEEGNETIVNQVVHTMDFHVS